MSEILTPAEVAEIGARCAAATPGPWYPHVTDDARFMNAVYVSTRPGSLEHDNRRGLDAGNAQQEPPDQVVAITRLQYPHLANAANERWDENAEFIAASRADIPSLIATLRQAWAEKDYWEMGSTQQYLMYQDSQRAVKQLLDEAVPFLDQNREQAYKDALRTIRKLREVLEFYADEANWVRGSWMADTDVDRGERARRALGGEEVRQ